jgi:hypothetical protein
VGWYKRPFADNELYIKANQLMGQIHYKQGFPSKDTPPPPNPPPHPLALVEKDRLIITAGTMKNTLVDIIRHGDGSIGWLRAGRLHRKAHRTD